MVFLNVYIKEAHPTDGWRMSSNDRAGIQFSQPKDFAERFGIAEQCSNHLNMKSPVLIDDILNTTCDNYAAFPDRLYIVDMEGKVAYKGGRGPFGYKPKEMEQSLLLIMMDAQLKARKQSANRSTKKSETGAPGDTPGPDSKTSSIKKNTPVKSRVKASQSVRPEPPGPDQPATKKPAKGKVR